ncbi:hypothetical protein E4U59_000276, partial [Claviceps monticola]
MANASHPHPRPEMQDLMVAISDVTSDDYFSGLDYGDLAMASEGPKPQLGDLDCDSELKDEALFPS